KSILDAVVSQDTRLTAVHLVDSHHCSDAPKFISVVLVSLSTMLRLELPHINVLSKVCVCMLLLQFYWLPNSNGQLQVDIMEQFGPLPFSLDFFTEVTDLNRLLRFLDAPPSSTFDNADDGDNELPET